MNFRLLLLLATFLPSALPAEEERKHHRIETDFNADGITDVAFSEPRLCGNAGCWWAIYIGRENGTYEKEEANLFFHPLAINFSTEGKKPIIRVYHRSGGGEGSLITYTFKENKFMEISSQTVFPGDNGVPEHQSLFHELFASLREKRIDEYITQVEYDRHLNEIRANQTCHTTPASAPR